LHENYQLNRFNGALWKSVREFYESVRNALFHGHELTTDGRKYTETLDAVLGAHDMFAQIYEWIDFWCPQRFTSGNFTAAVMPITEMPTLPADHPCADPDELSTT
jgi:hypothetical protein